MEVLEVKKDSVKVKVQLGLMGWVMELLKDWLNYWVRYQLMD